MNFPAAGLFFVLPTCLYTPVSQELWTPGHCTALNLRSLFAKQPQRSLGLSTTARDLISKINITSAPAGRRPHSPYATVLIWPNALFHPTVSLWQRYSELCINSFSINDFLLLIKQSPKLLFWHSGLIIYWPIIFPASSPMTSLCSVSSLVMQNSCFCQIFFPCESLPGIYYSWWWNIFSVITQLM